jgi:hypothetical protein
MWFEQLTGFEESPENVRDKLTLEGDSFFSLANRRSFTFGKLEIATLDQLRQKSHFHNAHHGKISVSEVVANVQELHSQTENVNALFQAASQFNLLEMIGPHVSPEQGIDRYERDYTQGPACAIACGAGTIYRNYFAEVNGQLGQTSNLQIDCLDLIAKELNNTELGLWTMRNGYALIGQAGLLSLNKKLSELTDDQRETLKGKLKVGIQWNTEVTISSNKQKVSQIYCSALPVSYNDIESIYWERFSRIILEATYEATLWAAAINMKNNNSNIVYLTLVGGGAFGNDEYWILESIQKAIRKFRQIPLDVRVVSYGESNPRLLKHIGEI